MFLSQHFIDPGSARIDDQMKVINHFPSFFSAEESMELCKPLSLAEIEKVLKNCAKDKSPDPDGWTVELFLGFFDIMGLDLLSMIEFSRFEGFMYNGLNSTFLTLIPKCSKPSSLSDYMPIALCNMAYKVVTNIIANLLKQKLVEVISKEQFGFLFNRQILDAVGVSQEILHTIKSKNLKALIHKMDLVKAYDWVN